MPHLRFLLSHINSCRHYKAPHASSLRRAAPVSRNTGSSPKLGRRSTPTLLPVHTADQLTASYSCEKYGYLPLILLHLLRSISLMSCMFLRVFALLRSAALSLSRATTLRPNAQPTLLYHPLFFVCPRSPVRGTV